MPADPLRSLLVKLENLICNVPTAVLIPWQIRWRLTFSSAATAAWCPLLAYIVCRASSIFSTRKHAVAAITRYFRTDFTLCTPHWRHTNTTNACSSGSYDFRPPSFDTTQLTNSQLLKKALVSWVASSLRVITEFNPTQLSCTATSCRGVLRSMINWIIHANGRIIISIRHCFSTDMFRLSISNLAICVCDQDLNRSLVNDRSLTKKPFVKPNWFREYSLRDSVRF